MNADRVYVVSLYEDGWIIGFEDNSGLRLYADENQQAHAYRQYPDGSEVEMDLSDD